MRSQPSSGPSSEDEADTAGSRRAILRGVALLLMLFLALAVFTWHRSGDYLIDFGRELYVPWRLSDGAVLYRDLDYLMGPAAAYVNAAIFSLAGPSVAALQISNLVVIGLVALLLVAYFRDVVHGQTVLLIVSSFFLLFGFSQALGHGIFNFLTPYSHEATHGMVYALVAITGATFAVRRAGAGWAVLGGVGLGLTFLTKPELFLAAAGACAAPFLLLSLRADTRSSLRAYVAWSFLGGAIFAVAGTAVLFLTGMSIAEALRSVTGAWTYVGRRGVSTSEFYAWVSGIQHPASNGLRMLGWTGAILSSAVLAVWAEAKWGQSIRGRPRGWLVIALPLLGFLMLTFPFVSWLNATTALPLVVPAATGYCLLRSRAADEREYRYRWIPLIAWGIFAELLLLKIFLAVRIVPYGFYLAMPATVLVLIMAVEVVPEAIESRFGHSIVTAHVMAILLVPFFAAHLATGYLSFARRSYPVGGASNSIDYWNSTAAPDGLLLNELVAAIEHEVPPDGSLAILPEGAGLNFLTRRLNPTAHISLAPPELAAFGESTILRDFERHPPDYLVVWPRPFFEYGYIEFGRDSAYARSIVDWYSAEYVLIDSVSARAGGAGRKSLFARFLIYKARAD